MKLYKGILFSVVAAALLISCKQGANEDTATAIESTPTEQLGTQEIVGTLQKASFQVEGMSCSLGCANVIEKKLANLDGVQHASVDFNNKFAVVEFDNAKQNIESITKTVETIADGAYSVEDLVLTED